MPRRAQHREGSLAGSECCHDAQVIARQPAAELSSKRATAVTGPAPTFERAGATRCAWLVMALVVCIQWVHGGLPATWWAAVNCSRRKSDMQHTLNASMPSTAPQRPDVPRPNQTHITARIGNFASCHQTCRSAGFTALSEKVQTVHRAVRNSRRRAAQAEGSGGRRVLCQKGMYIAGATVQRAARRRPPARHAKCVSSHAAAGGRGRRTAAPAASGRRGGGGVGGCHGSSGFVCGIMRRVRGATSEAVWGSAARTRTSSGCPQQPERAAHMQQRLPSTAREGASVPPSHVQQQAARVLHNLLDALQEGDRLAPAAGNVHKQGSEARELQALNNP